MRLKFLGFHDSWKAGQDTYVTGFGSVSEGQVVDIPEDLADFLLTSAVWEKSDEDLSVLQPDELPAEPEAPQGETEALQGQQDQEDQTATVTLTGENAGATTTEQGDN